MHLKPNNYKLYINEHFISNKIFIEKLYLKVIIDENIVIYDKTFPSKKIFDNNKSYNNDNPKLKEDFICYIKKEDFNEAKRDENGDCMVKIQFNHKNNNWKGGWYIDEGCLMEITQKEIDDEIKIMNQKLEEEERKKFFGF